MSKVLKRQSEESLEDLEEKLEDLRVRRHDQDKDLRSDLKPIEDSIKYGLNGLNNKHFLDVNHLVESAALAVLPDQQIKELNSQNNVSQTGFNEDNKVRFLQNNDSVSRPVNRDPGRPLDEIIEDAPQTLGEAREMFSRPPEDEEVDEFFDILDELYEGSEFQRYEKMLYGCLVDGDIDGEDFDSFLNWNNEVITAISDINDLGTAVIDSRLHDKDIDFEKYSTTIRLPEPPEDFGHNFTEGILNGFEEIIEYCESQETVEPHETVESSGLSLDRHITEIKVDDSLLPEDSSVYEQQLLDAGARYNHESDKKVGIDLMRGIIRDVRDLDVSDELKPSYEDKQPEAYGDLKGAIEQIVQDSEIKIGAGAGRRKKLDELMAGINYMEKCGAVYEDKQVLTQ